MKIAGIILVTILTFVLTGLKANQVTDSLESLLTTTEDTNKVKILCDLCWEYRFISADKSLDYGSKALVLSEKIGYDKGVAQSYNDMGIIFIDQSKYSKAISYFENALAIRKKQNDLPGISALYNKIGIVYQKQGKLKEALKYQIEALIIYDSLGQARWVAYSLNNIAIIHQNLGNLDQSLVYHERALAQRINLNDEYGEGMSYGNIGNVFVKMHDTIQAIGYYEKALEIFKKLNNDEAISIQLSNLGNIYLAKGQSKKAIGLLRESLDLREKISDKKGISSSLVKLGEAYTNLNNYDAAAKALYRGLRMAKEAQVVDEEMAAYLVLAKLYALQDQLDSAFALTAQYIDLKDSVYDQRLKQQIVDVQVKYETEKMERDMELLSSKNQLNEARLQQRRTEIWLLTFVIISVTGLSIFIYFRRKQKQKEAMDLALIKHNTLQLKAVIDGQEEERRRIARELHDGVGQKLAGIKLNWESISSGMKENEKYWELKEMAGLVDNAAGELRTISHQMMPKELEQFGLVPAVESMLYNNLKNTNIQYSFDHLGIEKRLPQLIELNLFRITQELVSNTIKHANANNLNIQLLKRQNNVVLIAEDDGCGFEVTDIDGLGIGLMNIESRVKSINAHLDIESELNKGTTIRVRIPV